ncbi:thiamine pyrophosphate-dependent dehydrogenase E1 component subunit alpha [Nonomuraea zeae]|uniref:Thiamine pyrophosphate-dependent dehydrogenase E1 component subunit alpha n=1 Tax=Nonomuraea zeae TaxID=1642303 RepID=A0A5S4FW99_9ACTN|nr:thiamine pyrophosphate-dependent dehydrogenase E1 component subunit alpha [Nonomuraea zeae]TMR24381.1 thiamine pyrophosphate-dependent dehydrogenase E1 component subunit alpha [Nonomuraea zeae]
MLDLSAATPRDFPYERLGVRALELMLLIRGFESRIEGYAQQKLIRGSTHPAVGMEAVAVGVALALQSHDTIASTHRGHAHCLAKGADPGRLLAEIFGRQDGYSHGKGGSMHAGAADLGILGTNGIVGASIGIATGAALASVQMGQDSVSVAFFGDGAINQGIFHESLNLAAIWSLPVVYICENNQYAQSARLQDMVVNPDLAARGPAYGIASARVDGMDVTAVHQVAHAAVERARSGAGPSLIVADTYRFLGHMVGDTEIYRGGAEVSRWRERDPIPLLAAQLNERRLLTPVMQQAAEQATKERLDAAEQAALSSAPPPPASAYTDVYGPHGGM